MDTIKLKINGQEIECEPGKTILDVVTEQNLDDIPTLCHSPELTPYGSCFLCVVEVKGRWNLVPACATRVAPDMEVETRNERIIESRKTALELLLSNMRASIPVLRAIALHSPGMESLFHHTYISLICFPSSLRLTLTACCFAFAPSIVKATTAESELLASFFHPTPDTWTQELRF